VQFVPAVVFPQILLCGLLVPREHMVAALRWFSALLPLTWAYDGLAHAVAGDTGGVVLRDALIVFGITVLALALGATTLRRRTA
jgi:ABC-2 type transport system permease protein